ncbi:Hypothetical predicted protein [Paramuricea clavata]|uniref:Uncharacterized protein n=1 Tax=Paramuricea clavata TaxID=317549 RepID=A0A7D9DKI7_PARCT|nr:Hypothetical predicted protein [Paramuricea clavata]
MEVEIIDNQSSEKKEREDGERRRWVEHFEELLNRPAPQNPPDIPPADRTLPVDCNKQTKEEIRNAIRQLKKGKAAGPDKSAEGRRINYSGDALPPL